MFGSPLVLVAVGLLGSVVVAVLTGRFLRAAGHRARGPADLAPARVPVDEVERRGHGPSARAS